MSARLAIEQVTFRYGERRALDSVSLQLGPAQILGLLGPNGGGKTTLFRLVTTLIPLQQGDIAIDGVDVRQNPSLVRRKLGVTFQSASLDGRLTVQENLTYQGHLYGLTGARLRDRMATVVGWLGIGNRLSDLAGTLSGGLQRRVEIAKSLLHQPTLLVLDEPSTGLDPGARRDLWLALEAVRTDEGLSILVTTHLMDEAERCDRLGILDRGRLVALDAPEMLRRSLGGDVLTLTTPHPETLARELQTQLGIAPTTWGTSLRIDHPRPQELIPGLLSQFGDSISSLAVSKPTLEDVFLKRTGHAFWETEHPVSES